LGTLVFALILFPSLLRAQTARPNPASETDQPVLKVPVKSLERDSEVLQLTPFEVRSSSDEDGYLTKKTASVSRVAVDFLDLPQSVSVISKQFISDYNLHEMRQVYEALPNVYTGSLDQSNRLFIRGSEVNVLFIDGVRSQTMNEQPLQFIDRVELVRGPSSSTFTNGQPGGSLNMATKTPTGRTGGTVEVGIGDYKNFLVNVDTEGVLTPSRLGKTAYRMVGFYDKGDFFIKEQSHHGAGGLLSFRTELNPTTLLNASMQYSSTTGVITDNATLIWGSRVGYDWMYTTYGNQTMFAPLPGSNPWTADRAINSYVGWAGGTLLPADLDAYPSNFRPSGTNDLFRSSVALQKSFWNNTLNIRFAGNLEKNKAVSQYVTVGGTAYVDPATGQPYPNGSSFVKLLTEYANKPAGNNTDANTTRRAFSLDANYRRELLAGKWMFALGVAEDDADSFSHNFTHTSFKNANGTDVWINFIPNGRDRTVNYGALKSLTRQTRAYNYRVGAFASINANYLNDRIQVQFSDRADRSASRSLNEITRVNTRAPEVKANGAPSYSLLVKPMKWLSIYALQAVHNDPIAQTFKYNQSRLVSDSSKQAAFNTIYGNYTEVISATPSGTLKEFGVKAELLGGAIAVSADVFEMTTAGAFVTNVINYFDATNQYYGGQVVQNSTGGSSARGGEVEVAGRFGKNLIISATYGITRGTRDVNPFLIEPPSTLRLHGKYFLPKINGYKFYVFGGVSRWGKFLTVQDTMTMYVPYAQYRYDLGLGCNRGNHSVELTKNNLKGDLLSISPQTAYALSSSPQMFLKYKYKF